MAEVNERFESTMAIDGITPSYIRIQSWLDDDYKTAVYSDASTASELDLVSMGMDQQRYEFHLKLVCLSSLVGKLQKCKKQNCTMLHACMHATTSSLLTVRVESGKPGWSCIQVTPTAWLQQRIHP